MRKVYLIRHGRPDIPCGERLCMGSMDLKLGIPGHLQSCLLAESMKEIPVSAVFSSPLSRSRQTAQYLAEPGRRCFGMPREMDGNEAEAVRFDQGVMILPGLEEQHLGEWDGLSFFEIKERWPELYKARGTDRSLLPCGAEPEASAKERFLAAVRQALSRSQGDICIVAHRSVSQMMIADVLGEESEQRYRYELEYCSVTTFEWDEEKQSFQLQAVGQRHCPELSEALCQKLLDAAGLPEHVKRHCAAVAREAERICRELQAAGYPSDRKNIVCAAWLHDIARLERHHARTGAEWIRMLGYMEIAELIEQHHDASHESVKLDAAAIVRMADRCIQEDKHVTLAQRFEGARQKFCSREAQNTSEARYQETQNICGQQYQEAQNVWTKRYQEALYLKEKINAICGKEVIL